jgi:hypothetical protein
MTAPHAWAAAAGLPRCCLKPSSEQTPQDSSSLKKQQFVENSRPEHRPEQ